MFNKLNKKGYNLMELIVVIIIIGVLVAMAVPKYLDHKKQADLAVIQNDSIVVRNVAMADYMSTDKLPKGEQGSPENLIEDLDKQLEAGKVFKNGFLIKSKDELGPNKHEADKESQGGEEFSLDNQKIKDFYLLNDTWVKANTRSTLPGRFLLDSDFNVYYVAKGGLSNSKTNKKEIKIETMSLGGHHSLAIDKDGDLWVWGRNANFQLGQKDIKEALVPIRCKNDPGLISVVSGEDFVLGLDKNNNVWSWGQNIFGMLGYESEEDNQFMPQKINSEFKAVKIAAGNNHAAAIDKNGDLWTWGKNDFNKLGYKTEKVKSHIPQKVPFPKDIKIKDVSLGNNHSAALDKDGNVWTWGEGGYGKLGNGNTKDVISPNKITSFDNNTKIEKISLGEHFSSAIDTDGNLYTWGKGDTALLGYMNDGNKKQETPKKVNGIPPVSSISFIRNHAIALDRNGNVWTWGNNSFGQLGIDNISQQITPIKIDKLQNIKEVDTGFMFSAALDEGGNLWMWGGGFEGNLGNGEKGVVKTPKIVKFTTE